MRVNTINQQTQNRQSFGIVKVPNKKKVTRFLIALLQDDVESTKKVIDTFEKVQKEQFENPYFNIKISHRLEEQDYEVEYLVADVVNKKDGKLVEPFFQAFNFPDINDGIVLRDSTKTDAKSIVKFLEKVNAFATNKAKVIESITKAINHEA